MTATASATANCDAAAAGMSTMEGTAFDEPVASGASGGRIVVTPLAPARYKLQMTLGANTIEKLRRAQDLLRHTIPDGDPAAILDRALTLLLDEVARTKLVATKRPRSNGPPSLRRSRHVPAAVRRAVWTRDEGRCTFTGTEGRCSETGFLELHHIEPYALGGATTSKGWRSAAARTTRTKRIVSSGFSRKRLRSTAFCRNFGELCRSLVQRPVAWAYTFRPRAIRRDADSS
jgi:hypothetical protein